MTQLILVRHGQTKKNISGKLHRTGDSEILNEEGRKQTGDEILIFDSRLCKTKDNE
ncbi:hypothetical protein B5M47_01710 [candidate division CPR3 bacterium 4484_211]|uniref:Phosphoglycerate mutase n=1 Tax=candidate division CPR3 bacterium 4484_211 TaxID=1968527 RepID=A0A1W9NZ07_UNCC3|nr:MAG: hypothetical protein B5M47_01710 [candidate division CPR3 bacterium 4484_211]RLD03028.1 MAG: hypothetical protein DRI56_13165 [Chloroflexota bacterium]